MIRIVKYPLPFDHKYCYKVRILSQPNLTVAVTKRWTGTLPTHPPPPPHKLLTANISAISQPIELNFFGNPPVGNSNVKPTKDFKLQVGASISISFVGHCQYLSHFSNN